MALDALTVGIEGRKVSWVLDADILGSSIRWTTTGQSALSNTALRTGAQMPIKHWHETIGDPTLADAILDRLIHNAHTINLKGESIRKKQNTKP